MARRIAGGKNRKKRRLKPPRVGPKFQADRTAALTRREALNFKGYRRRQWKATMRKTKDADLRLSATGRSALPDHLAVV